MAGTGAEKLVGDVIMWGFMGAVLVLIVTHAQGFSTSVGTTFAPVEYLAANISTAGASAMPTSSKG